MNSDKLKPCPFCGGKAELWHTNHYTYVDCENWDASDHNRHMVGVAAKTEQEAIEKWNRRADNGRYHTAER